MNDATLQSILAELTAIRLLIAAQGTGAQQAPRAAAPASQASAPAADGGPPPQPSMLIAQPGNVQVHFGKNTGIALSALTARSLEWYATEQPPKLDSSGRPFTPRPQEITLKNAARQLWHQNNGTLAGTPPVEPQRNAPPPRAAQTQVNLDDDSGEVPF